MLNSYLLYRIQNIISKDRKMKEEENQYPKHAPFDLHDLVQKEVLNQRVLDDDIIMVESIVFTDQPNLKVFCHNCRKQINKTVSILSSNSIYRCVGCFAKQQPSQAPFKVIKSLNFPLIEHNWKAIHETLFLSFLQIHGFNNWDDIREEMEFYGVKFSISELENHYYQCYLSNEEFLPNILNNENFFQKRQDHPSTLKTPVNPTTIISLVTVTQEQQREQKYVDVGDYQVEKHLQKKKINKENQIGFEFYNGRRKEFDVQYDNGAECMLADLQFRDDDSQEEKRIKLKIINTYNKRIQKRNQIKHFVTQHRLLDEDFQKEKYKQRNDLEKQAYEQLKPVARFTSPTQFNQLIQKVTFTNQLKSIIEGLRKFRRTHPSNFKSLDEFLNSQPQQSKPKKRGHNQNMKTGKKVEQMLEKCFNMNKSQFQQLVSNLAANGKKTVYKNIQAVMLQRNQ